MRTAIVPYSASAAVGAVVTKEVLSAAVASKQRYVFPPTVSWPYKVRVPPEVLKPLM